MGDLALEQIGDGGKPDMRMRTHVGFARDFRRQVQRPHVVEENEGPDHPPLRERQDAPDFEQTDIAAARGNDERKHGEGSIGGRVVLDEAAGSSYRGNMDRLIEGYRRFRAEVWPGAARAL